MWFDDSDITAIRDMVAQIASWDVDSEGNLVPPDPGVSLSVCVARQWYKGTWISQERIGGVIGTDTGCMAGTPLADLLFTVVISRVFSFAENPWMLMA